MGGSFGGVGIVAGVGVGVSGGLTTASTFGGLEAGGLIEGGTGVGFVGGGGGGGSRSAFSKGSGGKGMLRTPCPSWGWLRLTNGPVDESGIKLNLNSRKT